jgi:hypothetical protein
MGSLTSLGNTGMYMLQVNKPQSLKVQGKPTSTTTPITLNKKWTWIGYTPQFNLPTANALAGVNPVDNDVVKTQGAFDMYVSSVGRWMGSITNSGKGMQPGKGYMYYSNADETKVFNYPSVSSTLRSAPALRSAELTPHWTADVNRFGGNMTMIANIELNDMEVTGGNWEIAAFCGDVCRGSIIMQTEDGLPHPYLGFLMIYGNEESMDSISFRLYNHDTDREYTAKEKVGFRVDAMEGSISSPFMLTASGEGATSIEGLTDGLGIYPNPVVSDLHIARPYGSIEKIELFNMQGQLMYSRKDFDEESIDMTAMTAGVYLLHITHNGETTVLKVMKK